MTELHESLISQNDASYNLVTMWRGVIAMAWADGLVQPEEREYILQTIDVLEERKGLTTDQKAILLADLDAPQPIETILAQLNDARYRGFLVHFARILAYKDGVLHPDEAILLAKIEKSVKDSLDMDTIKTDVQIYVQKDMLKHDIEMQTQRPDTFWMSLLDQFMAMIGLGTTQNKV